MKAYTQDAYRRWLERSDVLCSEYILNRDTHNALIRIVTPVKSQKGKMWNSNIIYLLIFPVLTVHNTAWSRTFYHPYFANEPHAVPGMRNYFGFWDQTATRRSQEPTPASTSVKPGMGNDPPAPDTGCATCFFFPKNPQLWITSSWDQRKPCTILANTAHLPPTARRSHPVQSEAMPLWYIRFSPYTQVTHLVFYLLKPPNLAVEGDCMIAKITGEN